MEMTNENHKKPSRKLSNIQVRKKWWDKGRTVYILVISVRLCGRAGTARIFTKKHDIRNKNMKQS